LNTVLIDKNFNYELYSTILSCAKVSAVCKFAWYIREMYATSIMFSNTAGRTKIEKKMAARSRSPFTIRDHYTHQGSNLVRQEL
jgi:hypothetical protein